MHNLLSGKKLYTLRSKIASQIVPFLILLEK